MRQLFLPVPLTMDDREGLTLPDGSAASLVNFRADRGRLIRTGGSHLMDVAIGGTIRNIVEWFDTAPDFFHHLIALSTGAADNANLWSQTTRVWDPVGVAAFPPPLYYSAGRYSTANTLDALFVSGGLDNIFAVTLPSVAPINHDLDFGGGVGPANSGLAALNLIGFNSRLIACHVTETDIANSLTPLTFPTKIRWCADGDVTKWDPNNDPGAGFLFLEESPAGQQPITGAVVLGERAYIFRTNEIMELLPGNLPIFRVEVRVSGQGCMARHSIAVGDNVIFFLGRDNVYAFDGASMRPIGDAVFHSIYADALTDITNPTNAFTPNNLERYQAKAFTPRQEYWLLTPAGRVFVYNWRLNQWRIWDGRMTEALGTLGAAAGLPPTTDIVNILEELFASVVSVLNGAEQLIETELMMVGSAGSVYGMLLDAVANIGPATVLTSSVESRDVMALMVQDKALVPAQGRVNMLREVQVEGLAGSNCIVEASISQGESTLDIRPEQRDVEFGTDRITISDETIWWINLGFAKGARLTIENSGGNDGTYIIRRLVRNVLYVVEGFAMQGADTADFDSDGWYPVPIQLNPSGVGRAYFALAFHRLRIRIRVIEEAPFELKSVLAISWNDGGVQWR